MDEQLTLFGQQLVGDIQRCLEKSRLDEMMIHFVHIYAQLSKELQEGEVVSEVNTIVTEKMNNYEFRQTLEFFYAISVGEEARMLFDPTIDYNPKYDMDNFSDVYKEITVIKIKISNCLGYIKSQLFISRGDILDGFMDTSSRED